MSKHVVIMQEGVPIGFFPDKKIAMEALQYTKEGYVTEIDTDM